MTRSFLIWRRIWALLVISLLAGLFTSQTTSQPLIPPGPAASSGPATHLIFVNFSDGGGGNYPDLPPEQQRHA